MKVKGTALLRKRNQEKILEYLRKHEQCSRVDLQSALQVSRNTISLIVDDLIQKGVIVESAENRQQSIGRPRKAIALNPDFFHSIGILIMERKLEYVVLDYRLRPITTDTISIDNEMNILENLVDVLQHLIGKYPNIYGIGVAVPGLVNAKTGFVYHAANLNWENIDLEQHLKRHLSCKVSVFNSAKVASLQAVHHVVKKPVSSLFYMRIGEGIGGSFFIDQQLFYGNSWTAGEIGHVSIKSDGPVCRCGQKGCLEALISLQVFQQELHRLNPSWKELKHADDLKEAVAFYPSLQTTISNYGVLLGKALVNIIHLLNPEIIMIDSCYTKIDGFQKRTVETVKDSSLAFPFDETALHFADYIYSPAKGAAMAILLNFESVYSENLN